MEHIPPQMEKTCANVPLGDIYEVDFHLFRVDYQTRTTKKASFHLPTP